MHTEPLHPMRALMRRIAKSLHINPSVIKNKLGIDFYARDRAELLRQRGNDTTFAWGKKYAVLNERDETSGVMSGHYFHQDLYVAQRIFANNPKRHIDIGSRTDGFVAHVASFRTIEVLDIRPQPATVKNIQFRKANLMELPEGMSRCCDSVSSLHAIEHFGLGRYGDPVNYLGHVHAVEAIAKMLVPGGRFYFSVPMGPQRIEFNAHRVFTLKYLLQWLSADFTIERFSYVDDAGNFHENAVLSDDVVAVDFNCHYGCAIFELIRK